jgi:hypothetical protein
MARQTVALLTMELEAAQETIARLETEVATLKARPAAGEVRPREYRQGMIQCDLHGAQWPGRHGCPRCFCLTKGKPQPSATATA